MLVIQTLPLDKAIEPVVLIKIGSHTVKCLAWFLKVITEDALWIRSELCFRTKLGLKVVYEAAD